MQRQVRIKSTLFLVVLVGLTALLAGCGEDAVVAPQENPEPEFARVLDQPGPTGGDASLGDLAIGQRDFLGFRLIRPGVGGTLVVGRFTVTIPPDAIEEPMLLRIMDLTIERAGLVMTEIGPHGYEFVKPVTLTMDLEGTSLENAEDATIFWYDREQEAWVDVGGTFNPDDHTVSTKLDHFSRYGGGRAGW
ncbi:MAG: hypothetical protein GF355_06865 [Candidatus Eisenbacteria bacterium]|nr:hypothetical protein [Candidatus Eisenbacteria bacterium]